MLRYFLIPVLLLAACLAATPAYAGCSNPTGNEADRIYNYDYQTLQFCNGTNWVPFGAYNAYVGPGDIVSGATAWYGLRAYSNAVAATGTQKAINIRRASDNTTKDILIRKSGNLDTPTAVTFCASTTCYITEWYDQTGNGWNVTQSTNADQPQLVFGCLNGNPCISSGSSQLLTYASNITPTSGTMSFSAVAYQASASSFYIIRWAGSNDNNYFGAINANTWRLVGGASNNFYATASTGAWHAGQAVMNGASSVQNIDGTETTGSAVGNFASNPLNIAQNGGSIGEITEVGAWVSTVFTSSNRSILCHNQYLYWGTSTAC